MGRRPKSAVDYAAVLNPAEAIEPAEVAQQVLEKREDERKELIAEGKRQTAAVGYEFRPYYNRPQKHGLVKLILVERNPVRGHIYRSMIARNVSMAEVQKLAVLTAEQVAVEHKRRLTLPRYGF